MAGRSSSLEARVRSLIVWQLKWIAPSRRVLSPMPGAANDRHRPAEGDATYPMVFPRGFEHDRMLPVTPQRRHKRNAVTGVQFLVTRHLRCVARRIYAVL